MWTAISDFLVAFISSFTLERVSFMLFAFLAHDLPLAAYQLVCGYFRAEGLYKEYLIQPEENEPPPALISKAAKHLMIGHLVMQWIPLYFFYDLFVYLGVPPIYSPIQWRQLVLFIPFMILCDTLLYWSHRTLHHPLLYTRFHKQHHEFKSNVPFASEYFTLTEEICTGFIPTLAVCLLGSLSVFFADPIFFSFFFSFFPFFVFRISFLSYLFILFVSFS
jgi:sterol desaturase/sphingolipid hydroxylase (fatty acid hydroxylase superfamily)